MFDIDRLKKLQINLKILMFEPKTILTMYVEDSLEAGFNIKNDVDLVYYLYLCEIQKWLRDNKKIIIEVECLDINLYEVDYIFQNTEYFVVNILDNSKDPFKFDSYEEALLGGIEEVIQVLWKN